MNYIIDIIVLALIFLIVFLGYKKGFLRSLLHLFGFLIACLVSFWLGKLLAEWIFEAMVQPWLSSTIETQVIAGTNQNLAAAVDNMYTNLPGILSGPLDFLFGSKEAIVSRLQSSMDAGAASLTDAIVGLLRPMIVVLISILTVLLLFILCLILIRALDKVLIRVRKLPVIGSFDGLLGALVGILKAGLWMIIVVFLVKAFVLLTSNGVGWLNDKVIDSTILFRWLYHFDLISAFREINL